MNQITPFQNDLQQQMSREMYTAAQQASGTAFLLLALAFAFALIIAIWMYRDANARGKPGIAAGTIGLCSFFYGPIGTLVVACAWLLFRPQAVIRPVQTEELPRELPPDIQAGPTSEEYLQELAES